MTPRTLLELGPLARDATPEETAAHDTRSAELARHKLGRITAGDADGYHRVMCPAVMGKIRCPLRLASMTLDRQRPEILTPPGHPPACCARQTLTVPPEVAAKTRQKRVGPGGEKRRIDSHFGISYWPFITGSHKPFVEVQQNGLQGFVECANAKQLNTSCLPDLTLPAFLMQW